MYNLRKYLLSAILLCFTAAGSLEAVPDVGEVGAQLFTAGPQRTDAHPGNLPGKSPRPLLSGLCLNALLPDGSVRRERDMAELQRRQPPGAGPGRVER